MAFIVFLHVQTAEVKLFLAEREYMIPIEYSGWPWQRWGVVSV